MKMFAAKNPALAVGRKGQAGFPELRGEIHTYANGFGGYLSGDGVRITNADGVTCVAWRIEWDPNRYWEVEGTTFHPLIVRLPHGRGFYHGWTMGPHMIANVPDFHVCDDIEDAWRMAGDDAERAAEAESIYQEEEEVANEEEDSGRFTWSFDSYGGDGEVAT